MLQEGPGIAPDVTHPQKPCQLVAEPPDVSASVLRALLPTACLF